MRPSAPSCGVLCLWCESGLSGNASVDRNARSETTLSRVLARILRAAAWSPGSPRLIRAANSRPQSNSHMFSSRVAFRAERQVPPNSATDRAGKCRRNACATNCSSISSKSEKEGIAFLATCSPAPLSSPVRQGRPLGAKTKLSHQSLQGTLLPVEDFETMSGKASPMQQGAHPILYRPAEAVSATNGIYRPERPGSPINALGGGMRSPKPGKMPAQPKAGTFQVRARFLTPIPKTQKMAIWRVKWRNACIRDTRCL
jgi:hypothetical protein